MSQSYSRVCFGEALYPLMLYLVISSEEEINDTIFILDRRIPLNIQKRIPNAINENRSSFYYKSKWLLSCYGIYLRCGKFRFLQNADLFGLDFKWYLLRGSQINYIEDCPNIFNLWETSKLYKNYLKRNSYNPFKDKILKILFGPYYGFPVATSNKVKAVISTSFSDKKYLKGKPIKIFNLEKEWNDSSESKKKLILNIFDISPKDLDILKSKKIILLTQAFYSDKMVTEEEQVDIYRKILLNYNHNEVIIKPHPRDHINYSKLFPDILLFEKVVPMQFLSIIGIHFETVVTVSSSAALSFGDNVKIDWYGNQVHPGILKIEGERTLENALSIYNSRNRD